ncbi:hypothetical protein C8R48DRAFT_679351 [Suillus tomentosus]|nr:hypothetical protein C8R48DRAFT_679351 [Suillus tomentosus]
MSSRIGRNRTLQDQSRSIDRRSTGAALIILGQVEIEVLEDLLTLQNASLVNAINYFVLVLVLAGHNVDCKRTPISSPTASLKFEIHLPSHISGTRILYSGFCTFSISSVFLPGLPVRLSDPCASATKDPQVLGTARAMSRVSKESPDLSTWLRGRTSKGELDALKKLN